MNYMEWRKPKRYTIKDNYTHKEYNYSNFQFHLAFWLVYLGGLTVGLAIKIIL